MTLEELKTEISERIESEQDKLFNWVAYARNTYPQLDLLFHVPNGGKRNQKEAFNLKRQGVRAGVPACIEG